MKSKCDKFDFENKDLKDTNVATYAELKTAKKLLKESKCQSMCCDYPGRCYQAPNQQVKGNILCHSHAPSEAVSSVNSLQAARQLTDQFLEYSLEGRLLSAELAHNAVCTLKQTRININS